MKPDSTAGLISINLSTRCSTAIRRMLSGSKKHDAGLSYRRYSYSLCLHGESLSYHLRESFLPRRHGVNTDSSPDLGKKRRVIADQRINSSSRRIRYDD